MPICVSPSGSATLIREEHPENTARPSCVSPSGSDTFIKEEQSINT